MYQKKKKKKSIYIPLIIILGFILIYIVNLKKDYSKIEFFFRDIGTSVYSFLIPKVEINNSKIITGINKELEEENNELKKMLDLNIETYQFIYATVLKRDINWYQEITIDKGKKDNIKQNMAVISNDTLIGKVVKTTNHSSTIRLLTANDNSMKISVDIKSDNDTYHGILDGYLIDDDLIKINNVQKNSEININSKVYTNGLGGIFPSGIYIGRVVDITYDELGLNKILKVKTDTSYDKIRYVLVVNKEK